MNCRYCGNAHTSDNDWCRGCGVEKSATTVSNTAIRQRKIHARGFQTGRFVKPQQKSFLQRWATEILIALIAAIVFTEILRGGEIKIVLCALGSFFILNPILEHLTADE